MTPDRRDPSPRLMQVTVEWHSDGRRLATPRRALAIGAAIAAVGAIVIAQAPSSHPAATSQGIALRCERSETPRMFIGDSHPNIPIPVHVPGCP